MRGTPNSICFSSTRHNASPLQWRAFPVASLQDLFWEARHPTQVPPEQSMFIPMLVPYRWRLRLYTLSAHDTGSDIGTWKYPHLFLKVKWCTERGRCINFYLSVRKQVWQAGSNSIRKGQLEVEEDEWKDRNPACKGPNVSDKALNERLVDGPKLLLS